MWSLKKKKEKKVVDSEEKKELQNLASLKWSLSFIKRSRLQFLVTRLCFFSDLFLQSFLVKY